MPEKPAHVPRKIEFKGLIYEYRSSIEDNNSHSYAAIGTKNGLTLTIRKDGVVSFSPYESDSVFQPKIEEEPRTRCAFDIFCNVYNKKSILCNSLEESRRRKKCPNISGKGKNMVN